MEKNKLGIFAAIISIIGLALVSSWWCLFLLGIGFTLAVIGLFGSKGKEKATSLIAMLVAAAGILVMCQFAGFIPTLGFKPIGIESFKETFGMDGSEEDEDGEEESRSGKDSAGDTIEDYEKSGSKSKKGSGGIEDFVGVWNVLIDGHMIVYNFYEGGSGIMQSDSAAAELSWEQNGSANAVTIKYYDPSGALAETEEISFEINDDEMIMKKLDSGQELVLNRMSSLGN